MISLRLPSDLEKKLASYAKSHGKNRSEVIKESIHEFLKNHTDETPFSLGKDLFGVDSDSPEDLSSKRKKYIKDLLAKKNEKRKLN